MEDQELLKQKLHYDPDTGIFTALHSHGTRVKGEPVGYLTKDGYLVVGFNHKTPHLHRLAFLYMQGEWPTGAIDHKDGDRTNNSWDNLRVASRSTNSRNRKKNKNNTSGTTGVYFCAGRGRWDAYIHTDGKRKSLGSFMYEEDAIFARLTAEKDFGYWLDRTRED